MAVEREIPKLLCAARRHLEFLSDVTILEDLVQFIDGPNLWYLKVRFHIDSQCENIPTDTDWYVEVSAAYPLGNISIYPAIENGITNTWPHQSNNGYINKHGLWRLGNICVAVSSFMRDEGPPENPEKRLSWYVERSILWLSAAAKGELVKDGDYYELPDYGPAPPNLTVAFSEDIVSYMNWDGLEHSYGYATIANDPSGMVQYITSYCDANMDILFSTDWGRYVQNIQNSKTSDKADAIWLMARSAPVINGFQAPNNYKELKSALNAQNIDLFAIIRKLASRIRDANSHLLLLGFPIPEFIGGESEIVAWQAIKLPILAYGKNKINGFRANGEAGYWLLDKINEFESESPVRWLKTKNWESEAISARGQCDRELRGRHILVLGAGCLGSTLCELLVRGNVTNLTIMDDDLLEAGNLSRHTLAFPEVSSRKEISLADHLNRINPHANVDYISQWINSDNIDKNCRYHTIIDCTGSNEVLDLFEVHTFKKNSYFISYSVSYAASEIYLFVDYGRRPRVSIFKDILRRNVKMPDIPLPRGGIGCWHPLFPARADEIYMATAVVTQYLNKIFKESPPMPIAIVMNKSEQNGIVTGYQIKETYSNG